MTRITLRRGFLLLALTGILLVRTQETTPSVLPDADLQSSSTAVPSALDSSPAETVPPPHSPGDQEEGSTRPTQPTSGDEASGSDDARPTEAVGHSGGLFKDEPVKETDIPSRTSSEVGTSSEDSDPSVSSSHVTDVGQGTTPREPPEFGKDADESTPPSSPDDPSTVPSVYSRSSSVVGRDETTQVGTAQNGVRDVNATTTGGDAVDSTSGHPTSPLSLSEEFEQEKGNDDTPTPPEVPTSTAHEGESSGGETEVTRDLEVAASSLSVAAVHSERVEHPVSTRTSPTSLAALSSEDSIHPNAGTAQTPDVASTDAPPLGESTHLPRSSELDKFQDLVRHPESSELVTFDPDGMTHNSSQEPDAVTFTPVTFRVISDVISSVKFTDETTHAFELLEGSMNGGADREREPLSPGLSPHDVEPDREELSGKNTLPSTGVVPPGNDESEEMMNDSPHFGTVQSNKPTTGRDKELEESFSNRISSHPTGATSPHRTTPHELHFSTPSSERLEFRPVTASSPPTEVSGPASSTSPNMPAPSSAHESSETAMSDGDVWRTENATSTSNITGVAVKTSVSVSLPLSKSGPNSTVDAEDALLRNISGILPFPIHPDHHKESSVQTAEPSTAVPITTPGGLRIRKPKLKIGGSTDEPSDSTPRTRKPFLAPPQRSSTTVGPPVSIFKKSKTRVASITSSTTPRPFPQFSTLRVHYASRVPGAELVFSVEPVPTTAVPTTTETEEPFSDEPFTEPTQGPLVPPNDDDITLVKVAGCLTVDRGLLWHDQLNNRHSPQYREKANYVQIQLERLFRTSPIASQVWKIQIDGFSGRRGSRSVVIDFFLYLIKSRNEISTDDLTRVFHGKLNNNTFSRFTVDPSRTTFEFLNEEPMRPPTEAPESSDPEPVLPQWAIAVIVVGAASLIFIVLFAVVAILGRHHMRRRYSSKLNDEDSDRPGDWETKMAAAYENLAADTIYDAEDSDTYRKSYLVD